MSLARADPPSSIFKHFCTSHAVEGEIGKCGERVRAEGDGLDCVLSAHACYVINGLIHRRPWNTTVYVFAYGGAGITGRHFSPRTQDSYGGHFLRRGLAHSSASKCQIILTLEHPTNVIGGCAHVLLLSNKVVVVVPGPRSTYARRRQGRRHLSQNYYTGRCNTFVTRSSRSGLIFVLDTLGWFSREVCQDVPVPEFTRFHAIPVTRSTLFHSWKQCRTLPRMTPEYRRFLSSFCTAKSQ